MSEVPGSPVLADLSRYAALLNRTIKTNKDEIAKLISRTNSLREASGSSSSTNPPVYNVFSEEKKQASQHDLGEIAAQKRELEKELESMVAELERVMDKLRFATKAHENDVETLLGKLYKAKESNKELMRENIELKKKVNTLLVCLKETVEDTAIMEAEYTSLVNEVIHSQ